MIALQLCQSTRAHGLGVQILRGIDSTQVGVGRHNPDLLHNMTKACPLAVFLEFVARNSAR